MLFNKWKKGGGRERQKERDRRRGRAEKEEEDERQKGSGGQGRGRGQLRIKEVLGAGQTQQGSPVLCLLKSWSCGRMKGCGRANRLVP